MLGTARLKLIKQFLLCFVAFLKIASTVDGGMYLRPSCIVFDSPPVHE